MRPLNSKIIKQRYPFPLIEDCLARLSNKSIFTLLDLKDRFMKLNFIPISRSFLLFLHLMDNTSLLVYRLGFVRRPLSFSAV